MEFVIPEIVIFLIIFYIKEKVLQKITQILGRLIFSKHVKLAAPGPHASFIWPVLALSLKA